MTSFVSVSVILPVYNGEAFIQRSLESLTSQTLRDFEIIVIDDASTDTTTSIVTDFKSRFDNITLVRKQENTGVHNARLEGLRRAKGAWIGFVDSDDTVSPRTFDTMLAAGVRNSADIVVCEANSLTESGARLGRKVKLSKNELITSDIFNHFCALTFGTGMLWNKLYRREIILPAAKLAFPWQQNTNEDMLLNIGCFLHAKSVYLLKDPLYNYTRRRNSVTASMPGSLAYADIYRAYAAAIFLYSNLGDKVMLRITELYRKQLEFECYRIVDLDELLAHHDALHEATNIIMERYPLGLSILPARTGSRSLGFSATVFLSKMLERLLKN